jgi:AraC-like DNA-binding protein
LLGCLIEELAWMMAPGDDEDRLERARRYLVEHVGANLGMAEAARIARMSLRHFHRSFARRFGSPPKAYLRRLREERAVHLLVTTDLKLESIARAVNLPGASYLCRRIKRATGMTPGEIRSGS